MTTTEIIDDIGKTLAELEPNIKAMDEALSAYHGREMRYNGLTFDRMVRAYEKLKENLLIE